VPRRLDAGNQEQSLCDDHTIRNNIGYRKEVIPGGLECVSADSLEHSYQKEVWLPD
jgi:hypothetical protein